MSGSLWEWVVAEELVSELKEWLAVGSTKTRTTWTYQRDAAALWRATDGGAGLLEFIDVVWVTRR